MNGQDLGISHDDCDNTVAGWHGNVIFENITPTENRKTNHGIIDLKMQWDGNFVYFVTSIVAKCLPPDSDLKLKHLNQIKVKSNQIKSKQVKTERVA